MSVLLRPFLANAAIRVLRLDAGEGRSVLAVERLAVVESLLPSGTVHDGPPSCARNVTALSSERVHSSLEFSRRLHDWDG